MSHASRWIALLVAAPMLAVAVTPAAAQAPDVTGWATGEVAAVPVDESRPWGWATRAYMEDPDRELYNTAKAKLLAGQQIFSHTISGLDVERYCEEALHYDFTFFEMQHSTMSFADVEEMIAACPRVGATPIVRLPDAFESTIQKATDIGALGIIVPTVDDALEAREAARYARFPPTGRRSYGAGQGQGLWSPAVPQGQNYRNSFNDNMLVVVMIETVEGVENALEIASVPGVDAVFLGNADLASFSGLPQNTPPYRDLQIRTRNATYQAGKFWGNAAFQMATGNPFAEESRIHQNGPSNDGWTRPRGGGE